MSRYAISGANTTILSGTVAATGGSGDPTALMPGQSLMGRNLPSNRVLHLRSAWFFNASGAISVTLFDASAGVNATGATRKITLRCASVQTTMVDIPAPGLKFATGCVAAKETTDASGSFAAGYIGGNGYEEG